VDHDYQVSGLVIGCAIEVHKALGPGLKEKTYATTLCEVFDRRNIKFTCDRTIDVAFDGVKVGEYRPDLVVEGTVVVEVKSVLRKPPCPPYFSVSSERSDTIAGLRFLENPS